MGTETEEVKVGNWIRMDKNMIKLLPKDRPYSEVEAMFSYTIDIDHNNVNSIHGYARMWKWNRCKVRNFFMELLTSERPPSDLSATPKRPAKRLITNKLDVYYDHLATFERPASDL